MRRRSVGAVGAAAIALAVAAGVVGPGLVGGAGGGAGSQDSRGAPAIAPEAVELSTTIGSVTFRLGPKEGGAPGEVCLLVTDAAPVSDPVAVPTGAGSCGPSVNRDEGVYFARANGDGSISYWGMAPPGTVAAAAGSVQVPVTDEGFFVATTTDDSGLLTLHSSDGTTRTTRLR